MFVCLFKRLNRSVTRLSPEGTRLEQSPSQAHRAYISMLVVTTTPNNQSEQFYYQPQRMRKENLNQISIAQRLNALTKYRRFYSFLYVRSDKQCQFDVFFFLKTSPQLPDNNQNC